MNTNNEEFRLNQILKSASNGITKEEILNLFSEEKRDFIDFLLEKEKNKNTIIEFDGVFYHINNTEYRVGKFKDKKYNNQFVLIGNNSYTVEDSKTAIDEDTVLVKIIDKKSKIAYIERVLEREIRSVYGEVIQVKDDYYLNPDSPKFRKLKINLNKNDNIVVGSKAVVDLTEEVTDNCYNGTITGIIGYSNDPGIDILMETYKYGIYPYFSPEAEEEANNLPLEVRDIDKIGRCDLTKKQIFTIDGDDTKDIDDAVSLEILDNGNYLLGVHITDVTHYVEKGSALDMDAYLKGTSSYLASKVIPMYPAIISNGIGSLNPKQDRLTLTCSMEIDKEGNLVNYNIYESVINSNIQMTYRKVNDLLDDGIINFGYEEYIETLKKMYKLSLILRRNRIARGAFEIDREELKIDLDENGFPNKFDIRIQGKAENLIDLSGEVWTSPTGNTDNIVFGPYRIDGQAPTFDEVTVKSNSEEYNSTNPTIYLNINDNHTSKKSIKMCVSVDSDSCSIDSFHENTSEVTVPQIDKYTGKKHMIYITAVDEANNKNLYKIPYQVPKGYTIIYDSAGGTNCENKIVMAGDNNTAKLGTLCTPKLNGKKFKGWYLNNKKVNENTTIDKDVILGAKWE